MQHGCVLWNATNSPHSPKPLASTTFPPRPTTQEAACRRLPRREDPPLDMYRVNYTLNGTYPSALHDRRGDAVVGSLAYSIDQGAVTATGYLLEDADVARVTPSVQSILRDDAGIHEAREALADLPKTTFENERLEKILAPPTSFEEWRVGEALAEHHLATDLGCEFPWPDNRSTRNPNSSGGGVDLIGFHVGSRVRFVFVEAKTSHEQSWPPSSLTSRSQGLHHQLSGLNASDERSQWAIKYLMSNGLGKPWFYTFRQALTTYLTNEKDVIIYGILIHASNPNQNDLRARASSLAKSVEEPTSMALVAIYLTSELLTQIANAAVRLETTK